MRDYLQHGDRHRPGGSDPIPGLTSGGGGAVIAANGANFSGQTVPHGTTKNCSFSNTATTSDSSKLSWSTSVLTNDTLVIQGSGIAMLVASCKWTAGTAIDFKIFSGSGYEMFPHDGFKGFSGLGPASGGLAGAMPTLMDISWMSVVGPSTPVQVRMTNNDGVDSGPSDAYIACMFWPGIVPV